MSSDLHASIAGSKAATNPVATNITIENARTGPFTPMLSTRGSVVGARGTKAATPHAAAATPSTPPTSSTGATSATAKREATPRGTQCQPYGELAAATRHPGAEQTGQGSNTR